VSSGIACDIAGRRADLVGLLTAACHPTPVCDDIPNLITAPTTIVVTWAGTRWDAQWLHLFEVLVICTDRDSPTFFTNRDLHTAAVLGQLNAAQGVTRPKAGTRTVLVAGVAHELCSVVTVETTDNPVSI
jgi:hypothetical protein